MDGSTVAVIGGGLVGSLQAIYLAKRGYRVHLHESREDPRISGREGQDDGGRSFNLTLSARGREALKAVGLEDAVLKAGVPIHSRMVHSPGTGALYPMAYGNEGQYHYSLNRLKLNQLLLTEVEKYSNITTTFSHKLLRIDFTKDSRKLILQNSQGEEVVEQADFVFGCDGAHSAVRRQMDRCVGLSLSQNYIRHSYKQLTILPLADGTPAMALNYLHIWPRHELMLVAIPNPDHSFTTILFMPAAKFDAITTKKELVQFFLEYFPDAIDKIGQENLTRDYFQNVTSRLMWLKCSPYYIAEGALILGDAAHPMVPFYGQGMNTGFEDCMVFSEILREQGDLHKAASEYSKTRYKDAVTICELSMHNYVEMSSHVNSTVFLLRRRLDRFLSWLFPRQFLTLNSMVSFNSMPYSKAVEKAARQRKVVNRGLTVVLMLGLASASWAVYRLTSGYCT